MSVTLLWRLSDGAMDDAQKVLDAALARRTKIEELLVEARAAVEEDRRNNLGILGAPKRGRRNKTAALSAAVVRLESGLLSTRREDEMFARQSLSHVKCLAGRTSSSV